MRTRMSPIGEVFERLEFAVRDIARETEEGGAAAERSIQGMSLVRDSIQRSSGVIREMGKRTSVEGQA